MLYTKMLYTERLIKNVAFDVISVITVWGFLNCVKDEPLVFYNNIYIRIMIGVGVSTYILSKYNK
jgi:hypothetical protein